METLEYEANGEGELEISFSLEEDRIRNNELSRSNRSSKEPIADQKYRLDEKQLLQGGLEDSQISARINKVTFGTFRKQPACLIVFRLHFCPKSRGLFRFRTAAIQIDVEEIDKSKNDEEGLNEAASGESGRSSSATIAANHYAKSIDRSILSISDDEDDENYSGPLVVKYYPELIRGHIQHAAQTHGIKLYVEPAAVGAGVELGGSKTFVNEGQHLVHGRLIGSPETGVKWNIHENAATKSGIYEQPSFAVIVRYDVEKGFAMKSEMKATTLGGLAVKGKKSPRIAFRKKASTGSSDVIHLEDIDLEEETHMRVALLGGEGPGARGVGNWPHQRDVD